MSSSDVAVVKGEAIESDDESDIEFESSRYKKQAVMVSETYFFHLIFLLLIAFPNISGRKCCS